jgi:signal transduction histidine kinase
MRSSVAESNGHSRGGHVERIAADLDAHVVRELYRIGIGVQGVASAVAEAKLQARLLGYADALDALVARVRTMIVELGSDRRGLHLVSEVPYTLARRVLDVLDEDDCALGFPADVVFSGSLNGDLPNRLTDDLVAVLRQSVSNVVQHAHASAVRVAVGAAGGWVVLDVLDDGRGIGSAQANGGLTDMRQRARSHNGALELTEAARGGTHVRWSAPLARR